VASSTLLKRFKSVRKGAVHDMRCQGESKRLIVLYCRLRPLTATSKTYLTLKGKRSVLSRHFPLAILQKVVKSTAKRGEKMAKIKKIRIQAGFTPELVEKIDKWASELSITRSQMVAMSCRAGITHIIAAVSPMDALTQEQLSQIMAAAEVKNEVSSDK
jgi:hypothetical protein